MIRNIKSKTVTQFTGKDTTTNLASQAIGSLIAAQNCVILSDGAVHRAPGYTDILTATPGTGPITAIYDFQRSVDSKRFLIIQRGFTLSASVVKVSGDRDTYAAPTVLATLTSSNKCRFTTSNINCYLSNGTDALRLIDLNGTLTARNWGIAQPTLTPGITTSPGTLTLTYGRNYVYCDVARYTDSLGITRFTISAPSPISAYTGPVASVAINLSGWADSGDPQVNYRWIFATVDSPLNTSATFFFLAEIPEATLTYIDTSLDSALDQTRVAPLENYPAPPSPIVGQFQGRQCLLAKNQLRVSGGSDILLGIPDEAFPLDLFFNVPAGAKQANALVVLNSGQQLAISNGDTWFAYTGYNADTFTESDRVASPGQAGPDAGTHTPYGYVYLSPSKRLWIWNPSASASSAYAFSDPVELSVKLAGILQGTVGMESLSISALATAQVNWFSYGLQHYIVVSARTSSADPVTSGADWVSLWSVPSGVIAGAGSIAQTDKFPTDYWTTTADSLSSATSTVPFVLAGTPDGRIVRFPDGYADSGDFYQSSFSHAWIAPLEGSTKFYFVDFFVDSSDTASLLALGGPEKVMRVSARFIESPEDTANALQGTLLPLARIPKANPAQQSAFALRASLQLPATASGRYIRLNVTLVPQSAQVAFDVVVQKITLHYAPLYGPVP